MGNFNQSVIKHKTGLPDLAAESGNISRACRIMGFSLDTVYRYQAARDAGRVEAWFEVSRRKPNLKNRVEEATEQAVTECAKNSGYCPKYIICQFIHIPKFINRY